MSASEYQHWVQFYGLDPWGEQRADMRMARLVGAVAAPHVKERIDPNDLMLFPDDAHAIPDNVQDHERQMMLKLARTAGKD